MARLHMKFRNIHRKARQAGETLFASRPWHGSEEERQSKYERFLLDAATVYGIPTPTLAVIPQGDVYGYVAPNTIVLNKYSVVSLFNAFRLHMQYMGAVDVPFADLRDAQAWACSLFYTLRPIQFRKMVRAGRIRGVFATDLLTSATLAARQEEVDEAFSGLIAENFTDTEVEDLEDESADGFDDEGDDEAEPTTLGAYTNPNVSTEQNYSRTEAAAILGVSVSTIRNMTNDGRLVGVQDGRRSLVTGASLARIVPASEVSE